MHSLSRNTQLFNFTFPLAFLCFITTAKTAFGTWLLLYAWLLNKAKNTSKNLRKADLSVMKRRSKRLNCTNKLERIIERMSQVHLTAL